MRKIKGQGGLTKRLTSNWGKINKEKFAQSIEKSINIFKTKMALIQVEMDVVSFSSSHDFYEQILSILSFVRYVGKPRKWTIYSDGSHTPKHIMLLTEGFEFIEVRIGDLQNIDTITGHCKPILLPYLPALLDYAQKFPLGKKLFYYLNHPVERATLFIDSDILFYNKASLFHVLLSENVAGWFLPDDDWGCLDSRYKEKNSRELFQVNSGFFLLKNELHSLEAGLNFLKSLDYKYEYFSEQTTYHILFRSNHLMPLDPRIFVLNSGDQFDFSYLYPRDSMAIRHYTGPVRHKMWQRDWKWQLSID